MLEPSLPPWISLAKLILSISELFVLFLSSRDLAVNSPLQNDGTHFLAGLIHRNLALDLDPALLGKSLATNPGDSPQANKDAGSSMNHRDSETAIWSYNSNDQSLSAIWFNYVDDFPYSTLAFISYLANADSFELSSTPTPPNGGTAVVCILIGKSFRKDA